MAEHKFQQPVNAGRPGWAPQDVRPRGFQQLAVLNAGWTRRLTRAATEAAIDMPFKR